MLRAIEKFPKAGSKAPWKLRMTYHQDFLDFNRAELDDGKLKFSRAAKDCAGVRSSRRQSRSDLRSLM